MNAKTESPNESDFIYIGPLNGPDEVIQIRIFSDVDMWLHQDQPLIGRFDAPTPKSLHLTIIRVKGIKPMTSGHMVKIY